MVKCLPDETKWCDCPDSVAWPRATHDLLTVPQKNDHLWAYGLPSLFSRAPLGCKSQESRSCLSLPSQAQDDGKLLWNIPALTAECGVCGWCVRSFLLTSAGMEPRPQEPGKDCLPSILGVPHSRESLGSRSEIGRRRESPLLSGAPQGFSLSRRAAGDWMRTVEVVFLQRRNRSRWELGGKGGLSARRRCLEQTLALCRQRFSERKEGAGLVQMPETRALLTEFL